jgi:hypothetical protein
MSRATQIAPWALSVILCLALGGTWFKLNSELVHAQSELADLKNQYAQLSDESTKRQREAEQKYSSLVSEANRKISEADKKISEASNKLQEVATAASQQIELANQPEAQVRVSFRKAFLASGSVAKITSTSNEPIAITAEIQRPSTGKARSYELTLNPNQWKEIGEIEGWAFVAGDSIRIMQANHKAQLSSAP